MRAWTAVRNERGAALAIVAVSIAALLGLAAIAVDLSMLYKTRNDAQRAADASALAGASAYLKWKPADAVDSAWGRAIDYAHANFIGGTQVDVSNQKVWKRNDTTFVDFTEGQIQVMPSKEKVRVVLKRASLNTWFGHVLGKDAVTIAAKAAAVASNSGTGKCVKPFAIPDMWFDNDNDVNKNLLWDGTTGNGKNQTPGESWQYKSDPTDYYRRYQDPTTGDTRAFTGYGSDFRNGTKDNGKKYYDDYGRPISIKLTNPADNPASSFFFPWVLPGSKAGAKDYRENIWQCNPAAVTLGTDVVVDGSPVDTIDLNKPGNMVGPTAQGIDSLMKQDSLACWSEAPDANHSGFTAGTVKRRSPGSQACNQDYPEWEASPRVMLAPMFDPKYITNGRSGMTFNNMALWFLEGQKNPKSPVVARFLYFAKGTGPAGPVTGSLIKKLRLVE